MENVNYLQTLNGAQNTTSGTITAQDGAITTISDNATNSGMGYAQNCGNGLLSGSINYYPYYYSYPYTPPALLTVDKAENGFIIKKGGKTFIAKTAEEIVKYLK